MMEVANEGSLKEEFTKGEVQIAKKKALDTLVELLNSPQGQIKLDAAKLLLDYAYSA